MTAPNLRRVHRLGVDLDNTIVCYDRLFHRLALERGLVPESLPATKIAVRRHLRDTGREDEWTELQGVAYGPRMAEAEPFPGCLEALQRAHTLAIEVVVVSHRTRVPYRGERHDLHAAAIAWLERHAWVTGDASSLRRERVFLEVGRDEKCARIAALDCRHFVDDLPEIFAHAAFPTGSTQGILFDPDGAHVAVEGVPRVGSWHEIGKRVATWKPRA